MATAHVNVKGRTSMDGRGWSAGLRKMETGTKAASARMRSGFAGAIGGVFAIGFLASATRRIVQHADQIDKTAKRIGTSTDTIQKFDFAATQSGASMGDVEKAFFNTAKAMESAKQGLTTHIRAFEAFGISMAVLRSSTPEEIFLKIAGAIDEAGGAMDNAKSLQDIMGRGGKALVPAFMAGFEGLAAQAPEGIDAETIQKLVQFNDEMDRLKREALPLAADAVGMLADTFSMLNEGTGGAGTSLGERAENTVTNTAAMFTLPGALAGLVRVIQGGNFFKGTSVTEDEAQAMVDAVNIDKTDAELKAGRAAAAAAEGSDSDGSVNSAVDKLGVAFAKPSFQLNSLQSIGAAVTQAGTSLEKDNNKLFHAMSRSMKKVADNTADE